MERSSGVRAWRVALKSVVESLLGSAAGSMDRLALSPQVVRQGFSSVKWHGTRVVSCRKHPCIRCVRVLCSCSGSAVVVMCPLRARCRCPNRSAAAACVRHMVALGWNGDLESHVGGGGWCIPCPDYGFCLIGTVSSRVSSLGHRRGIGERRGAHTRHHAPWNVHSTQDALHHACFHIFAGRFVHTVPSLSPQTRLLHPVPDARRRPHLHLPCPHERRSEARPRARRSRRTSTTLATHEHDARDARARRQ
jgi:hypothetical protein